MALSRHCLRSCPTAWVAASPVDGWPFCAEWPGANSSGGRWAAGPTGVWDRRISLASPPPPPLPCTPAPSAGTLAGCKPPTVPIAPTALRCTTSHRCCAWSAARLLRWIDLPARVFRGAAIGARQRGWVRGGTTKTAAAHVQASTRPWPPWPCLLQRRRRQTLLYLTRPGTYVAHARPVSAGGKWALQQPSPAQHRRWLGPGGQWAWRLSGRAARWAPDISPSVGMLVLAAWHGSHTPYCHCVCVQVQLRAPHPARAKKDHHRQPWPSCVSPSSLLFPLHILAPRVLRSPPSVLLPHLLLFVPFSLFPLSHARSLRSPASRSLRPLETKRRFVSSTLRLPLPPYPRSASSTT